MTSTSADETRLARDDYSLRIVGLHTGITSVALLIGVIGQRAGIDLTTPAAELTAIIVSVVLSIVVETLSLSVCSAQLNTLWHSRQPLRWSVLLFAQWLVIVVLNATFVLIHFVFGD